MCFSAQASFAASAALIVISALCFSKARNNAQKLLASGPLFFGMQQALEGLVWMTLNKGDHTSSLHMCGTYGFLSFAYIFWPLYVPFTVYIFEKNAQRKQIALALFILGCLIATAGLIALSLFGYNAQPTDHHLVYTYSDAFSIFPASVLTLLQYVLLGLYCAAVIGSLLISTTPHMWLLGALIATGFIVAQIAYTIAFGSVWCYFAALASMVSYYMILKMNEK